MKIRKSKSLELAGPFLGKEVEVIIDRSVGTKHPKYDFIYPVNYGYISGIKAPDGSDLDAYYLGIDFPINRKKGEVIAIIHRTDDDDDKLVVVPSGTKMTDKEIEESVAFQEKWFDHEILREYK